MPALAASSRQSEITVLSSLIHKMTASSLPATEELISKAEQETPYLNEWQVANLREAKRNFAHASLIDEKLQQKHTQATNECEFIWREARSKDDYNLLKPYLKAVLNLTKEIAAVKSLNTLNYLSMTL